MLIHLKMPPVPLEQQITSQKQLHLNAIFPITSPLEIKIDLLFIHH